MFVIGDVNFFIFLFKDSHQGGELFLRGSGEAQSHERVVGILLKHIPGDQAAGIDKVRFKVRMFGDFFIIEGGRREDVEIFQAAATDSSVTVRSSATPKSGCAPKEAKQVPLAG